MNGDAMTCDMAGPGGNEASHIHFFIKFGDEEFERLAENEGDPAT